MAFQVEKEEEDSEKKDEMDDDIMFTGLGEDDKTKPSVAPRWVTRVFAADCLCRIIHLCENADKTHLDLAAARSAKAKNPKGEVVAVFESNDQVALYGFDDFTSCFFKRFSFQVTCWCCICLI